MNHLSFEGSKNLVLQFIGKDERELAIDNKYSRDFKWGALFVVQTKSSIEKNENRILGYPLLLVDKIERSITPLYKTGPYSIWSSPLLIRQPYRRL